MSTTATPCPLTRPIPSWAAFVLIGDVYVSVDDHLAACDADHFTRRS